MEIQIIFENPLYISYEKEPDVLVINFADENLFITPNGIKIQPEHRTLRRNLSRQLPEQAKELDSLITFSEEG